MGCIGLKPLCPDKDTSPELLEEQGSGKSALCVCLCVCVCVSFIIFSSVVTPIVEERTAHSLPFKRENDMSRGRHSWRMQQQLLLQ